jgi:DNA invertase Pin-like site-specific DNA recombinase
MDFYYTRVSTIGQNTERQFDGLDIPADQLFEDKISGSKKSRPALDQLIKTIRAGDIVHVWSSDRAARNLKHLLELIEAIKSKGAAIHFHKEGWTFKEGNDSQDNAMQEMMLSVFGAVHQFQRAMINEAAAEGRAVAKSRGVKFGRKSQFSARQVAEIKEQRESGKSVSKIAIDFDTRRPAIYRALAS